MADHVITQIRDKTVANLGAMATVPAARVFVDRLYPLERGDLPCVLISTGADSAFPASFGSGIVFDRSLTIDVHVCVSTTSGFDTDANAIQNEVEKAIAADPTLGGIVTSIKYTGRSKNVSGEGDTPFVALSLNYNVTYRTVSTAPDVAV